MGVFYLENQIVTQLEYLDLTVVVLSLPVVLLAVLLLFFSVKKQYRPSNTNTPTISPSLSVIIPFRNEGSNLLAQARYFSKLFENVQRIPIYWVDDYSTDDVSDFINFTEQQNNFTVIRSSEEPGKKHALKLAIEKANTDWVFLMDVDSRPDRAILSTDFMNIDAQQKMLLVPILPKPSTSLIGKFFDLDFISLHFAGFKSVAFKRPLLANGAAMLVNRDAYIKSLKHRTDWDIPSGDDVFAMMAIKSEFGRASIGALPLESPGVEVSFPDNLSALWSQRRRWASKVSQIKGGWFQFMSWLVLTGSIAILPIAFIGVFNSHPFALGLFSFFMIAEAVYLILACTKLRRRDLIWIIIPAMALYPFYIVGILATPIFAKLTWK